jgi:hypothetical protein
MKKRVSGFDWFAVGVITIWTVQIGVLIAIGYAVVHFVSKYW